MAFSLKTTLKVLLFAAPGPLGVQAIQAVFTRWHERRAEARVAEEAEVGVEVVEPVEPAGEPGQQLLPGVPLPDAEVPSLVTATQIRDVVREIEADLREAGEVCTIREGPQGWRLYTLPEHAEWVRCLRDEPPPVRLSASVLETLAVVAYRQPVTRAEIESIRGVSCENSVNKLLERGLVKIAGRADLPGRPIQYATTEAFLDFVGVRGVEELPASDVLSSRQIDDWLREGTRKVEDEAVGLPGLESVLAEPRAPGGGEVAREGGPA